MPREVLQAREKEWRLVVSPPVACAKQVQKGARGEKRDAGSLLCDIGMIPTLVWVLRRKPLVRMLCRVTRLP